MMGDRSEDLLLSQFILEAPMPRRVVLIVLIALFSLGLLFVHPAFSLTDKEATDFRALVFGEGQ